MLFYFVLFCIVGFVIGIVLKDLKIGIAVIVVITAGWAFKHGQWALATLVELAIGYAVARVLMKEIKKSE